MADGGNIRKGIMAASMVLVVVLVAIAFALPLFSHAAQEGFDSFTDAVSDISMSDDAESPDRDGEEDAADDEAEGESDEGTEADGSTDDGSSESDDEAEGESGEHAEDGGAAANESGDSDDQADAAGLDSKGEGEEESDSDELGEPGSEQDEQAGEGSEPDSQGDAADDVALGEASDSETTDAEGESDEDAHPKGNDPHGSYELRLIVSLGKAAVRDGDAILGEHDGIYLLGFKSEKAIAAAEKYYAAHADWCERDIAMGAAAEDAPEGEPAPVNADDNALALLDEGAGSQGGGASAGKPLVALVDTGAPADSAVVGSAFFIGDDATDRNGHAAAMLDAMKSEDAGVQVLALKALDDDGKGSASSVYAAIEYAIQAGAKIINLSLAGSANEGNAAIAEAAADALAHGCVVVAAAGNGGYDASKITPANIEGVFTVGACDEEGNVLDSSNRGECVDGYVVADSASVAAARVSGWLSQDGASDGWRERVRVAPSMVSPTGALAYQDLVDIDPGMPATAAAVGDPFEVCNNYGFSITLKYVTQSGSNGGQRIDSNKSWDLYVYNGNIQNKAKLKYASFGTATGTNNNYVYKGIYTKPNGEGTLLVNAQGAFQNGFANGSFLSTTTKVYLYMAVKSYKITLNNQSASDAGTGAVYATSAGLYLDEACSSNKKMGGTANGIAVPKKNGHLFGGYYTSANGGGTQIIKANGYLANAGNFTSDSQVYAYWIPVRTVSLDNQSADTAGTSKIYATSSNCFLDEGCSLKMTAGPNVSNPITLPTKSGYTFEGYYTEKDGGGTQIISKRGGVTETNRGFSANTTLYAKWDPVNCKVTLNTQSATNAGTKTLYSNITGSYLDSSHTQLMTTNANNIDVPTKTGFTFGGYYTEVDGGGTQVLNANGYVVSSTVACYTEDKTLYAKWTRNVYAVALDNQDADAGKEGSAAVYERYGESVHLTLADASANPAVKAMTATSNPITLPEKSGAVFEGYWTTKTGGVMYIDAKGYIAPSFSNTNYTNNEGVLYAHWGRIPAFKITLDDHGGQGGSGAVWESPNNNVYLDEALTLPMSGVVNPVGIPAKVHYSFKGYFKYAASGTQYINDQGYRIVSNFPDTEFSAAATIHAQWEPDVYSIALDNQGADVPGAANVYEKYGEGIYLDSAATTKISTSNPIEKPKKDGLQFVGYFTQQGGQGNRYIGSNGDKTNNFTSTTYVDNSGILYADYQGYKITLDDDGGRNDGTKEVYEKYGTGLFMDSHCSDAEAMAAGKTIVKPTKANYTFGGYYTKKDGEGVMVIDVDGNENVSGLQQLWATPVDWPEADKKVWAKWIPNVYKVELDANNPDDDETTLTQNSKAVFERYGESVHLTEDDANVPEKAMSVSENPIEPPVKLGYAFEGYFTNATGGSKYIDEDGHVTSSFNTKHFTETTSSKVLYAHWEKIPAYEITLDDTEGQGGSGSIWQAPENDVFLDQALTQAMSDSSNPVAIPTREHYTFKGYFKSKTSASSTQYINDQGYRIVANFPNNEFKSAATIYAHWEPVVYQITLDNQGADESTPGSKFVYELYDEGIYTDEEVADEMTRKKNPIEIPVRDGYVFRGYYTEPNGGGSRYIYLDGHKLGGFSDTAFEDNDGVLYAYWTPAPVAVLPITGGVGDPMTLLWGAAIAVGCASCVLMFRSRRQTAHARLGRHSAAVARHAAGARVSRRSSQGQRGSKARGDARGQSSPRAQAGARMQRKARDTRVSRGNRGSRGVHGAHGAATRGLASRGTRRP